MHLAHIMGVGMNERRSGEVKKTPINVPLTTNSTPKKKGCGCGSKIKKN